MEIFEAIDRNDLNEVTQILKNNENVHQCNSKGIAPIHYASATNNLQLIQLLIDHNANVKMTMKNEGQNTPLHIAALSSTPEVIELLIKNGADVNAVDTWNWTPLMLAISSEKIENVKTLLKYNSSCNQKNDEGLNSLHLSTKTTTSSLILSELILEKDQSSCLGQDKLGRTPLQYAIKYEREELSDLILKYNWKCSQLKDSKGNNALEYCSN
eukprot:gene5778-9599_t